MKIAKREEKRKEYEYTHRYGRSRPDQAVITPGWLTSDRGIMYKCVCVRAFAATSQSIDYYMKYA